MGRIIIIVSYHFIHMKIVKFKAWHRKLNNTGTMLDVKTIEFLSDNTTNVNIDFPSPILLPFTGLLDRNGREVYKGDIVRFLKKIGYGWGNDKGDICEVKWFDTGSYVGFGFRPDVPLTANKARNIEVIGNVYENLELSQQQ